MCNCEWQIVACPNCNGKGTVIQIDYEEDDGYGDQEWKTTVTCRRCSGKRLIKVSLADLNE